VQLWALLYLLNRGEVRQVVVFSGMTVIAGAALIKDLWLAPPAHREVGLLRGSAVGRVDFWREFGWWRPAHALLVYLDLLGCILSRSAPTRSLVGFGKVAALGGSGSRLEPRRWVAIVRKNGTLGQKSGAESTLASPASQRRQRRTSWQRAQTFSASRRAP
jgi:hypothetical protein